MKLRCFFVHVLVCLHVLGRPAWLGQRCSFGTIKPWTSFTADYHGFWSEFHALGAGADLKTFTEDRKSDGRFTAEFMQNFVDLNTLNTSWDRIEDSKELMRGLLAKERKKMEKKEQRERRKIEKAEQKRVKEENERERIKKEEEELAQRMMEENRRIQEAEEAKNKAIEELRKRGQATFDAYNELMAEDHEAWKKHEAARKTKAAKDILKNQLKNTGKM